MNLFHNCMQNIIESSIVDCKKYGHPLTTTVAKNVYAYSER